MRHALEMDRIKLVVYQAGWLTWEDYVLLIISSWGHEIITRRVHDLRQWMKDPEQLREKLSFFLNVDGTG